MSDRRWSNRYAVLKDEVELDMIEEVTEDSASQDSENIGKNEKIASLNEPVYDEQKQSNYDVQDVSEVQSKSDLRELTITVQVHHHQNDLEKVSVDQENSENSNENELLVNLSTLDPGQLMMISVKLDVNSYKALIDSGSNAFFVRKKILDKCNEVLDDSSKCNVKGLGNAKLKVLGNTSLHCETLGCDMEQFKFLVVADECVNFDVILGLDFLKRNKLCIDMSKRTVTRVEKKSENNFPHIQ